jgi:hypothetical protein
VTLPEDLPPDIRATLAVLENMSDGELWRIAQGTFPEEAYEQLSELRELRRARSLTGDEQAMLDHLLEEADLLTLRRAYAAVLLKRRGAIALRPLLEMPDDTDVRIFVASRPPTSQEGKRLVTIVEEWLSEWHAYYPECPTSACETLFGGQVLLWAIDDRHRFDDASLAGVSNTELDPLYRRLERFVAECDPPLRVHPNMALLVGDELVPLDSDQRERVKALLRTSQITEETPILNTCTVAEWRAGRLVRRLCDDAGIARSFLGQRSS